MSKEGIRQKSYIGFAQEKYSNGEMTMQYFYDFFKRHENEFEDS